MVDKLQKQLENTQLDKGESLIPEPDKTSSDGIEMWVLEVKTLEKRV